MSDAATGFTRVCSVDELPAEGAAKAVIDGRDVAIVHTDEGIFAIDDICTHANVSLSEGEVEGCLIECWLHGSQFDLRTGQPLQLPATVPVAVHQVKVEGNDVYVALSETVPSA